MVLGGGQSGLATSWWLTERGVEHIILDRGAVGDTWRRRWDSFCLVTPNWTLDLPGFPYRGDDSDGFLSRDELVQYLVDYAASFNPPLQSGIEVERVSRTEAGWLVETNQESWHADNVIVAMGTYATPRIPQGGEALAKSIDQIHSSDYRQAADLRAGGVMIIGSGQSGGQIADDLRRAGRQVWISTGSAPWIPRRYRGHDIFWWLVQVGFFDVPIDLHPMGPAVRFVPNPQLSGFDGGKDINPRAFGRDGIRLLGRFAGADGHICSFEGNLESNLDSADQFADEIAALIDRYISENGIDAPADTNQRVQWQPEVVPTQLDLAKEEIATVIWATGYRSDFSTIDADCFDDTGYPVQRRGVTTEPGLYFVGLHWLHTRRSGLFMGVGRDAEYLVDHILSRYR
jgi:putative flavoprotein involved in K+ transport